MSFALFNEFFKGPAKRFLNDSIALALSEDGEDLTSRAIFRGDQACKAEIIAKQDTLAAGLPIIPLVLNQVEPGAGGGVTLLCPEGAHVQANTAVAEIACRTTTLLKSERVMLNYICRLSGIANLTQAYVQALAGFKAVLLDTRKTAPGLRYPEKYAVLIGGGRSHRKNLEEMLMVKDNHIDQAGGIEAAVALLRQAYDPCPPIEVECGTLDEVKEAAKLNVDRIMLDNMDLAMIEKALALIPKHIESEVSGRVDISNIAQIARLGPDFISAGKITHQAGAADFSLRIVKQS